MAEYYHSNTVHLDLTKREFLDLMVNASSCEDACIGNAFIVLGKRLGQIGNADQAMMVITVKNGD